MAELTTILRQQSKLGPINVARAAMRDAAAELDRLKARVEDLEAALDRAEDLIGPFAKEADQWDASVSDAYRPGVTEPGYSQAHANAEFSIGDLRAALAWKEKNNVER